jgi:hypothetical protein
MTIPTIIPLAIIMCGSAVMITTMLLVSRHVSLRRRTLPSANNDEMARRLERIEQAVETTAVEIERLAESNRFLTKLLAEKSSAPR